MPLWCVLLVKLKPQDMLSVVWSGVGLDHRIYLGTTWLCFSLQQLSLVQTMPFENLVVDSQHLQCLEYDLKNLNVWGWFCLLNEKELHNDLIDAWVGREGAGRLCKIVYHGVSFITINNAANPTEAAAMMIRALLARRGLVLNECGRRIAMRRSIATNTRRNMESVTATFSTYKTAYVAKTILGSVERMIAPTKTAESAIANASI